MTAILEKAKQTAEKKREREEQRRRDQVSPRVSSY
jgi:hypothetical protein